MTNYLAMDTESGNVLGEDTNLAEAIEYAKRYEPPLVVFHFEGDRLIVDWPDIDPTEIVDWPDIDPTEKEKEDELDA